MSTMNDEQIQRISRAVADPKRFSMLRQIARDGDLLCVALEAHGSLSPATISHHLTVLQEAGLIEVSREGRNARMVLDRAKWKAYLDALASL
jgi:ArsR family transcriptional regulator